MNDLKNDRVDELPPGQNSDCRALQKCDIIAFWNELRICGDPGATTWDVLGKAAKYLREQLGLSQRAAAAELGISFVHLCRIENAKSSLSPEILEKFRATWGIDIYMLAVCLFGEPDQLPAGLRGPMKSLRLAWQEQVAELIKQRRSGTGRQCSTFSI